MLIRRLAASLAGAPSYRTIAEMLGRGEDTTLATPGLVRPALVAALHTDIPRPTLVVVAGEEAAERFWRQTAAFLGRDQVLHYPDRSDLPWSDTAPDLDQVGARARALYSLDKNRHVVVVASARALLRTVPPQGSRAFDPLVLAQSATLDLEEATERLARMGYERVDVAEAPGQFAVRGGTLDVYGAGTPAPVRADLFGDEIETLKRYVPTTGQTIGDSEPLEIYPCRELVIGARGAENVAKVLGEKARKDTELAHHVEMIQQGVYFNGIERYLPLLYKRAGMATDYLGADVLVVAAEPRTLFDDASRRHEELAGLASRLLR
jgi:transcription-repair coupling factor (superfamily II helicase)